MVLADRLTEKKIYNFGKTFQYFTYILCTVSTRFHEKSGGVMPGLAVMAELCVSD